MALYSNGPTELEHLDGPSFIAMFDLDANFRIKYVSGSSFSAIGFEPWEMINDTAWDYIIRIEGWDALLDHERTVSTYETAVFQWKWLRHKTGPWVLVECMTAVVGSTMISAVHVLPSSYSYRESAAYVKRQLKDGPRPGPIITEMRAAFLLNRFSRASPVMFATQEVTRLLKLRPQEIVGNSFYHLVQESCLQNIVFAIERAKAYNEVVYLRFWYQNPYYERRSDLPFHIWGGKDGSRIQSRASHGVELEGVCTPTDDGLIVILRRAKAHARQYIGVHNHFAPPTSKFAMDDDTHMMDTDSSSPEDE